MTGAASADADPQAFLSGLVESLTRALPPEVVGQVLTVERARSLSDRLAGRPGAIVELRVGDAAETMTLRHDAGKRWSAETARVSGGVIISRRTLTLGEWLSALTGRVAAIAGDAAGDAAAASRALQSLGIQPAGADVRVDDADIAGGLRALVARVAGRIPDAAADAVQQIADQLADTLPRVLGAGEPEVIVRRTATVYLPDTLRAYLALPVDWASDHVFPDGTTPAQALVAQLTALESATKKMRDAALEQDASALLVNGRFLSDRFASSSLDLS